MARQTKFPEGESLAHDTLDAVINAPMFVAEYLVSLAASIVSDITLFTVFLAGAAVGFATHWEIGLATFFVLYSVLRLVGNLAGAIANAGMSVGSGVFNGLGQHGQVLTQPQPHPGELPEA